MLVNGNMITLILCVNWFSAHRNLTDTAPVVTPGQTNFLGQLGGLLPILDEDKKDRFLHPVKRMEQQ